MSGFVWVYLNSSLHTHVGSALLTGPLAQPNLELRIQQPLALVIELHTDTSTPSLYSGGDQTQDIFTK